MLRAKQRKKFRQQFTEKLMELGNIIIAALVLSQFISGKKFSFIVFTCGMTSAIICYIISYFVSE